MMDAARECRMTGPGLGIILSEVELAAMDVANNSGERTDLRGL